MLYVLLLLDDDDDQAGPGRRSEEAAAVAHMGAKEAQTPPTEHKWPRPTAPGAARDRKFARDYSRRG